MADLERGTGQGPIATTVVPATQQQAHGDIEGLPALFGRLGEDVVTLLDTKISLLKVELKEDVAAYARAAAMIGTGVVVAVIGFALVNIAIAFFVSSLFNFSEAVNYALGFIITGIAYIAIGGVLIFVMKNRLAARSVTPERSVDELRKDKQWLKNETQG